MPRSIKFRGLLLSLSVAASIGALAACSSQGSSGGAASVAKTDAPMPPITEMDAAMNAPMPQPMPLSESDTLTPVAMTAAAAATAPGDGSVETRIAKLEQTVGSLRSDYNRIMPAFASLNTTNERIQTLLDEIERETGKRPAAADIPAASSAQQGQTPSLATPPMAHEMAKPEKPAAAPVAAKNAAVAKAAPATSPAMPAAQANKPAAAPATIPAKAEAAPNVAPAAGGNMVTAVRIGEHGTKTRLVMDLTAKTKPEFKYDLDNGEKLLLVEMPSSGWGGAESGKPANSPIIAGWSVQKGASGGSSVAIQLKKNARILSTEFLKAEGKDPARLVMDIAPGT